MQQHSATPVPDQGDAVLDYQAVGQDGGLQIPLDSKYLDSAANHQALVGGSTTGLLDLEKYGDTSGGLVRRRSTAVAIVPAALTSGPSEETFGPSES